MKRFLLTLLFAVAWVVGSAAPVSADMGATIYYTSGPVHCLEGTWHLEAVGSDILYRSEVTGIIGLNSCSIPLQGWQRAGNNYGARATLEHWNGSTWTHCRDSGDFQYGPADETWTGYAAGELTSGLPCGSGQYRVFAEWNAYADGQYRYGSGYSGVETFLI